MHIAQAPATSAAVTRRADAVRSALATTPEPGQRGHLQHTLTSAIRTRHYSRRTEQAYWHWTRAFVRWSGMRHPLEMGAPEISAFLSHLATTVEVSASTQRQALAALLFLYREALGVELPWIDDIVRAKQSHKLPVVLTRDEVDRLWQQIPAASKRGLVLRLLYGTGMRLMEGLRLRVQDIDFGAGSITLPDGKGAPTFHEIRSLSKRLYDEQGNVDTKALLGHRTEKMGALYADPRGVAPIRVRVG